jgi:hypothetical protein
MFILPYSKHQADQLPVGSKIADPNPDQQQPSHNILQPGVLRKLTRDGALLCAR